MTVKAVIYTRVSTDKQTAENQLPDLERWASQLNLFNSREPIEIIRTYTEQESAWKQGHQVELPRLIADGMKGQFKLVLVWALDRLCRMGPREQLEIVHKLDMYGVHVYSFQEQFINVEDPNLRELLISLVGYIAKAESTRKSERTKAGIARKRAEGWQPGRPKGSTDKKKRKPRRPSFG